MGIARARLECIRGAGFIGASVSPISRAHPCREEAYRRRTETLPLQRLQRSAQPEPEPEISDDEDELEVEIREAEELMEFQMTLPVSRSPTLHQIDAFLRHACRGDETLSLEILGTEREIVPQFVAKP